MPATSDPGLGDAPRLIGPYEIVGRLGAGGMGEVYRGRDSRLGRDVAIKILPSAFAQDPDRLARFQREAQVLASLNHPNIAAIYGVEEHALVMELVEGPTLADRITEGPMQLEEALALARQIADALEAAHEKNVVHRDLKPANVKVTADGRVKVLDFGLAKAMTEEVPTAEPSISPTLTMRATLAGVILGTAAYMSPEQARGKPVDKRADIWAFGVVLFEMLTGRTLFESETISDSLAAVLTREPDFDRVPVKLRRLLRRCLEKDPNKRLRDIGEVGAWLEEEPVAPAAKSGRLPWGIASLAALIAIAFAWYSVRRAEPELKPLIRLPVDLGSDVALDSGRGRVVIISPDGSTLAYVSRRRLYIRRLDQGTASELAGTDGAYNPFFSPDGRWIAFFANGQLKKISLDGGVPSKICDASSSPYLSGAWGEDGNIFAVLSLPFSLVRVPSSGGTPVPVPQLQGEGHHWPQILPGGKAVLFNTGERPPGQGSGTDLLTIPGGQWKRLGDRRLGHYSPSGHLLFQEQGALFASLFDLERLEVSGTPVQVWQGLAVNSAAVGPTFDLSRNGILVYRIAEQGGPPSAQWLDASGKTQSALSKPGAYARPRLSPDGRRLAIGVRAREDGRGQRQNSDIFKYDLENGRETRLTFDGNYAGPIWTPDGGYIVASSVKGDGMYWMRSDGSSTPKPLLPGKQNRQFPFSFSDQKRLAFMEEYAVGSYHLWTVSIESDGGGLRAGKPEPFFQTPEKDERHPMFSPDGRWLAYSSNELEIKQIFVRAFPGTASSNRFQISKDGGVDPVWSQDGRKLFFRTEDNQVMVADCHPHGDSFEGDNPRIWTPARLADIGPAANFDVARDGRILAIVPNSTAEQKTEHHVVFLMNFFDELRRRVPGGK